VSDVSFIKFKNDLYTAEARTNFRIIQFLSERFSEIKILRGLRPNATFGCEQSEQVGLLLKAKCRTKVSTDFAVARSRLYFYQIPRIEAPETLSLSVFKKFVLNSSRGF